VIGFVAALLIIVLIRSHGGTNRFVSSLLLPDEDKGLLVQLFDLKRQPSEREVSAIDKRLLEELQADGRIEPVVAEPKAEPAGVKAAAEQPVKEPAPAQAVEIAKTTAQEPSGVEAPKTEPVEAAKTVAPAAAVKEAGSKERGSETAPAGTEAASVESGSEPSAQSSEGTQVAALAASESASKPGVEKPKDQEPPQPVATTAPVPVVATELEIYEGSALLKDGASMSMDKLGSSKWTAKVQGLEGRAANDIKKVFSLNVFDPQSSHVIGKLAPERVSFEKGDVAVLSGGLRGLKQADVKSGSFRADLVYSGEVIASRAFGLHVLRVAVSARTTTGPQKVTIVNVPTLVDESGRKITGAEHAAELPRPVAPPPASAAEPVLVPQPQAPAPSLSAGLPPARGYQEPAAVPERREVVASSVGPIEDTAAFVPPPAVEEVRRSYSGSLRMLGAGGGERSLTLRLVFRGSDISGDATVEGFSPLVLAGKVLSHGGWEIFMQNAETKFRLTSVKKSDALFKGSYEMPNERLRGPWEVRAN